MKPSVLLLVPTLLAPIAAPGCQIAGAASTQPSSTRILSQDLPAEIAVLRVENATTGSIVPRSELRRALRQRLVDLGFTPLATAFVDQRVPEGTPPERARVGQAAILQVTVHGWFDAAAGSQGRLRFNLQARLLGPDGRLLADVVRAGERRLDSLAAASLSPEQREQTLLEQVVRDLLAPLPGPPAL